MSRPNYDHAWIAQLRHRGWTWHQVATWLQEDDFTPTAKQLRQAHAKWARNNPVDLAAAVAELPEIPVAQGEEAEGPPSPVAPAGVVVEEWVPGPNGGTQHIRYPGATEDHRAEAQEFWDDARQDFLGLVAGEPRKAPEIIIPGAPGMLVEMAIQDPHFGMLAYGREVGADQDIYTIEQDYTAAAEHLVSLSRIYNPARFLYIVGNDMAHVNQPGIGGKGGTTKAGTPQDMDTRRSKIFTTMRRCAIAGIDAAASVAPVDVVIVPGNHDPDEVFRLGEVLDAWYTHHPHFASPHVRVFNEPKKRKYYGYAKNAFLLTHGEEYRRKRDPLPLIMATECPADIWVASEGGSRECHTGHNHIRLEGGYYPTAEVEESRAVVVRSLPGLTSTDAWHYEQGYEHRRAATLLTYHPQTGFSGLHEYRPSMRKR